jgi:hypothetical protein
VQYQQVSLLVGSGRRLDVDFGRNSEAVVNKVARGVNGIEVASRVVIGEMADPANAFTLQSIKGRLRPGETPQAIAKDPHYIKV